MNKHSKFVRSMFGAALSSAALISAPAQADLLGSVSGGAGASFIGGLRSHSLDLSSQGAAGISRDGMQLPHTEAIRRKSVGAVQRVTATGRTAASAVGQSKTAVAEESSQVIASTGIRSQRAALGATSTGAAATEAGDQARNGLRGVAGVDVIASQNTQHADAAGEASTQVQSRLASNARRSSDHVGKVLTAQRLDQATAHRRSPSTTTGTTANAGAGGSASVSGANTSADAQASAQGSIQR